MLWKRLFAGAPPTNKNKINGAIPANKNKFARAGVVFFTNALIFSCHDLAFFGVQIENADWQVE